MGEVRLYGPDGLPLPPAPKPKYAVTPGQERARALQGGRGAWGGPAYDAADVWGQHMAAWQPYLWSPDAELNMYRDRIVSRVRDLVRNDGWANGAVTRILDNAIGAAIRPIPKPDWQWMQLVTGHKTFDAAWAVEFGKVAKTYFRGWATNDLGKYCDAARNQEFADMMRTAFRHKLVDGDALAFMDYDLDRVGRGRARYATCIQAIDPDRLSNPQLQFDQHSMRGGISVDKRGAATGYWIRRAHQGDWFSAAESMTWDLVPRETAWGRPVIVHDYDSDRAGQHRGGAGIFTPVLQRLKALVKYDGAELDAALLNAMFGAYIESPFDPQLVGEALSTDDKLLSTYQGERIGFHEKHGHALVLGDARIPVMFPGEKVNLVTATHPQSGFKAFESAVLRNAATCVGLSAQQITNDWSDVNYSSARGALLEAWKTLHRRRHDFSQGYCGPIRACWLEESFDEDDGYPWPSGAKRDFALYRGALSRADWLGPGVGWLDPVAEVQSSIMRMDAGLSTLERELAEQGLDFEEVLAQRAYELKLFDKLGIPRPEWAGQLVAAGSQTGGAQQKGERIKPPTQPTKPAAE